ncbi:class I fructose-bisphosphate aldolase [Bartonella sp. TP]|uniref:class I fructose-bisphosphate aldolase n=1 Tax=Bartonella sp. TP TaxID=3057550 RepID=UPI0025AEE127|nr:class I fructose-bisphosphate aldolase [Bartonella sp. TP]MDN5248487.1 fructose-bisphosphate aldolase class I [Alphaproteobacteria bacterium]WJW79588.1 fructose-bisphosphate aldolase class I [Bartonella sp. TP]
MLDNIETIANYLVSDGKGILAADESNATITKRFVAIGVDSTYESRRDYREMLFRTSNAMKNYISGVILYDETIRQKAADGRMLTDYITEAGALIGIKVDIGAKSLANFANETITEGLDNLRERLKEYHAIGARFAKWRAVIAINDKDLPSYSALRQNAQALARYAALCQENGIVPIVEPEILMDSPPATHNIARCYDVTTATLHAVFEELFVARVKFEAMVLKPNMVIDGMNNRIASAQQVAANTISCLKNVVPASVAGIAFLSGGQSEIEATEHLDIMNRQVDLPWKLSFSYGRALQAPALKAWAGRKENVALAQQAFEKRARMNFLAAQGKWSLHEETSQ